MLSEALRYPFGGDRGDAAETLAVGFGLHLVSVWVPVLPLVPVLGYLLRVLRPDAVDAPPRFTDVPSLLRDGVVAAVVAAAYLAVPVVGLAITARGLFLGGPGAGVGRLGVIVGGAATILFVCCFTYPLPAALAAAARSGLRTAFDVRALLGVVTNARYFYGWSIGVGALGVAAAFATSPARPVALVGYFLLFYAEVVAAAAVRDAVGGKRFLGSC
ncbi:DUF4013 domain-containing protein [Halobaculum sp. P14]|uniref:DUF4013 domain-containing protein n=1 Tax=Halobaculum sp. P14 TaxID=3421638 RepID=UPI003EB7ACF7